MFEAARYESLRGSGSLWRRLNFTSVFSVAYSESHRISPFRLVEGENLGVRRVVHPANGLSDGENTRPLVQNGKLGGQVGTEMSQLEGTFPQQGDISQALISLSMGFEGCEALEICQLKGCVPEKASSSWGIQPMNLHWRWGFNLGDSHL